MPIIPWNPMNDFRSLNRQLEQMLDRFQSGSLLEPLTSTEEPWPSVDVYEDKEEIVFRAELPGMDQKQVEVLIEDSTLALRGERKLFHEEKKENYRRLESCYGTFSRSFSLPSTIDRDKMRAEMRNGVLEVHVPKREGAKAKSIPITT